MQPSFLDFIAHHFITTPLQIIHGDFMKVQLPYFDLCVANIPYK